MNMTLNGLKTAYNNGTTTPSEVMATIRKTATALNDNPVFIHVLTVDEQQPYLDALGDKDPATHPLWGVPFAIKDNIDVAHIPTTAGCPDFAYTPKQHATAVKNLLDAGAIPVGKTNLDQFATGLNGTRSPYGISKNPFNPEYISGGSSAGSPVVVAMGLVTFALGTDTAGSGRVPAGLNNILGVKPTIGMVSASGMVPACRSLDCITIFTGTTSDANIILSAMSSFDITDGYAQKTPFDNSIRAFGEWHKPLKIAVIDPSQLQFFGDMEYEKCYFDTIATLQQHGVVIVSLDYNSFRDAASLLYEGAWVAERTHALWDLLENNPDAIHPVVRGIVKQGKKYSATDAFAGQYTLHDLKQQSLAKIIGVDCFLTPTAGRFYKIDEMLKNPIEYNSNLGYYMNFMNLFDMCAVSVPTTFTQSGLPFGVTISHTHMQDRKLLSIAGYIQHIFPQNIGVTNTAVNNTYTTACLDTMVNVVVCGAHLDGLPLNWQLTERGAALVQSTTSAPVYRLYALENTTPPRPAMLRDTSNGGAIALEIWQMPLSAFGSFVACIPHPLGIGKVELADGTWESGFICGHMDCIQNATEITHLGGWRAYMATKS